MVYFKLRVQPPLLQKYLQTFSFRCEDSVLRWVERSKLRLKANLKERVHSTIILISKQ